MRITSITAAGLAALQLAGCATTSLRDVRPIPISQISGVLFEAKRQIGVYTAYQRSPYGYTRIFADSRTKNCGNGMIGLDISTATLELTSESEGTAGIDIALEPVPTSFGTIGAKAGASQVTTDSQKLVLDVKVLRANPGRDFHPADLKTAPLAVALINLWQASLAAGDQKTDACFQIRKGSATGNTFTLGITWATTVGGSVSLGLAPVVVTPSGSSTSKTGNTITVSFEPHDFSRPLPPPPAPCDPQATPTECVNTLRNLGLSKG